MQSSSGKHVFAYDAGAFLNEQRRNILVAVFGSAMQRGASHVIKNIDPGTVVKKYSHHLLMTSHYRPVQRCYQVAVESIDIDSRSNELSNVASVTFGSSPVEGT
jgi:hypothetical protein